MVRALSASVRHACVYVAVDRGKCLPACVEKLVRRKVHGKHFGAPPFYRLVGENTATHPFTLRKQKKCRALSREVFIEAASEGLLWRLGIEVDRQKSEWFGGGVGEEFVKLLQIHIRTNLFMNFLQLILIFQFEQTQQCMAIAARTEASSV